MKQNDYTSPDIRCVVLHSNILSTSVPSNYKCGSSCALWHTCLDRRVGTFCIDKIDKYKQSSKLQNVW